MDDSVKIQLPTVALRGLTILPGMIIHFDLSRAKSIAAAEEAMRNEQVLFVATQKNEAKEDPSAKDLYEIGSITRIKQLDRLSDGLVRVMVEADARGTLIEQIEENDFIKTLVSVTEDYLDVEKNEEIAMVRELRGLLIRYGMLFPKYTKVLERKIELVESVCRTCDIIACSLPFKNIDKQRILSAVSARERYQVTTEILQNEIEIGNIRKDLTEKLQKRVNKNQRDYVLKEQMNAIREELGDTDAAVFEEYEQKLSKLEAGSEVKEKLESEIKRLKSLPQSSSESAVERTYIETLLQMPWDKESKENYDLKRAEEILEEDHYGLEKVKERILEFLAVRSMKAKTGNKTAADSPILCLVGPPGTGKTSIAKSVARALNKEYVRISLGGVRDEAEIRGHRKTYVGAMPGRIAEGIKQAGVANPLFLLDEIDKVSSDYKGDTASALLEVLDSEQNHKFRDHYLEVPLDLSKVLFIATANTTSTIAKPLLDRMELIEVNSYTDNEKLHIAKNYLVKKTMEKNGLTKKMFSINDAALEAIIANYTKEAGVRELERKLSELGRKAVRELLKDEKNAKVKITSKNLEDYLGKEKYHINFANDKDEVGLVRGLAWTAAGGETLEIEVNMMPGKGEVKLTGQMGDVMKESAMAGFTYARSVGKKYHINADVFKKNDFHIHIPEGAVPKDGPSAGITMALALISVLTDKKVSAKVAMTGEITLRGRVLPIGGLKEKMLAAKKAGIQKILVPADNAKDVEEISDEIKSGMKICFVEQMEDVIKEALVMS